MQGRSAVERQLRPCAERAVGGCDDDVAVAAAGEYRGGVRKHLLQPGELSAAARQTFVVPDVGHEQPAGGQRPVRGAEEFHGGEWTGRVRTREDVADTDLRVDGEASSGLP